MLHRYAAGTLAALIVCLTALGLAWRRERIVPAWFVIALLAIVLVQGTLGMLTVTWRLKPLIVTLHLLFGLTTLSLLWWLVLTLRQRATRGAALPTSRRPSASHRRAAPGAAGADCHQPADRAWRLDQQQLCRHRLPRSAHLPGPLVAAGRFSRRLSCHGRPRA